jgi:hypothetical protein
MESKGTSLFRIKLEGDEKELSEGIRVLKVP